jgi:hypothetical protein
MLYSGLPNATYDAGGRLRTSQLTTLFDGKTLNEDNAQMWHIVGTGNNSFTHNTNVMSVTSGQYLIRQSNLFTQYYSGKSQLVELTFDNFQPQTNVTKRIGYYSSSATAPYNTTLDGFFLESSNGVVSIGVYNAGTLIASIPQSSWNGTVATYDWTKFTVAIFDFLWLGGTELRLFLKLPNDEFVLAHTFYHAGSGDGTFIKSPNQPVRYEIRSTTGTGAMTSVCSQVSTEGSNFESGESRALYSPVLVNCNTVSTIYALKGIRKRTTFRDVAVKITKIGAVNGTTADSGVLFLLKDPVLSAPLTYVDAGKIQDGTAATSITVSSTGTVIFAIPISNVAESAEITENISTWLQNKIDNTMHEYVLAFMPYTSNQSVSATLSIKLYA